MNIAFSQTAMDIKAQAALRETVRSVSNGNVCKLCKALSLATLLQAVTVFCLTFSLGLLFFPLMG